MFKSDKNILLNLLIIKFCALGIFYPVHINNIFGFVMDEELIIDSQRPDQEKGVCKCYSQTDNDPTAVEIPLRKQNIFNTVSRTEEYLRERRIPELIRFLLTKVIAKGCHDPIEYLEKLIDECMLFRAGHGLPPVLYEEQHLEAIIKSFDPGQRGWMTAEQVNKAYLTIGLTPEHDNLKEKIATTSVFENLKRNQEQELFELLSAGTHN